MAVILATISAAALSACNTATVSGGPGGSLSLGISQIPTGSGFDATGLMHSVDTGNGIIRAFANTSGSETVLAGTGTLGFSGDNGPAISAELNAPGGDAIDNWGDDVVADTYNSRIRIVAKSNRTKFGITMTAGDIYTLAGNGVFGYSGNGGAGTSAQLFLPGAVSSDNSGNIIVSDTYNNVIRVVAAVSGSYYGVSMAAGYIYTIAGIGTNGYSGDGGVATSAELSGPTGTTVDGSGNILVADTGNNTIRLIANVTATIYGQSMTAGDIYTIVGNGISGYSGDGGLATSAELNGPTGIAADSSHNIIVADTYNNAVRVFPGTTATYYGQSMTAGDIYTIAGDGNPGFAGDGGPASSAELDTPTGITMGPNHSIAISDSQNYRTRLISESHHVYFGVSMSNGDIYTIAGNGSSRDSGDGSAVAAAQLNGPQGVASTSNASTVVADSGNNRIRLVASTTGTFFGQSMTAGDMYTIAGNGEPGYSGDGGIGTSAELEDPNGVTVDGSGNIVIADGGNNVIRVLAITTSTFYGQSMAGGYIYTIAGDGVGAYFGDGGSATSAGINYPGQIDTDASGNVLIADAGNNVIRTVAATSGTFYGQSMTAGDIYTIAGNGIGQYSGDGSSATAASLNFPGGLTVDTTGNVLVADSSNNVVRVIAIATGTQYGQSMTAGDIYTLAGTGAAGSSGNGGSASSATFNDPSDLAIDQYGNIAISDTGNNQIRGYALNSGTYYGASATAGDVYLVAGTGTAGFGGDGSSWNYAEFDKPVGLAMDSSGDLLVADSSTNRVRKLTP